MLLLAPLYVIALDFVGIELVMEIGWMVGLNDWIDGWMVWLGLIGLSVVLIVGLGIQKGKGKHQ